MISIEINGIQYTDWHQAQVLSTLAALADSFSITGRNRFTDYQIKAGDECKVYIADELQITGYIDTIKAGLDGMITLMGRDKTGDLVDSQLPGQTTFNQLTPIDIITKICDQFDIDVVADLETMATIELFVVAQDETAGEAIGRMASDYALIINSTPEGALNIQNGTDLPFHGNSFIEGDSITSATVIANDRRRFSEFTAIGQRYALPQVSGSVAGTSNRTRVRRKIIDGGIDSATCGFSAIRLSQWEEGQSVRVVMDPVGLWLLPAGILINITSPALGINGQMAIEQALTKFTGGDATTQFTLVSPEAYGGDPITCEWLK